MSGCIATKAMCTKFVPKFSKLLARVVTSKPISTAVPSRHGAWQCLSDSPLLTFPQNKTQLTTAGHPLILLPVPHN